MNIAQGLRALALLGIPGVASAQSSPPLQLEVPDDQRWLEAHRTLSAHTLQVRCLAYSPSGLLATGGADRLICLWDDQGKLVEKRRLVQPGAG